MSWINQKESILERRLNEMTIGDSLESPYSSFVVYCIPDTVTEYQKAFEIQSVDDSDFKPQVKKRVSSTLRLLLSVGGDETFNIIPRGAHNQIRIESPALGYEAEIAVIGSEKPVLDISCAMNVSITEKVRRFFLFLSNKQTNWIS